MVKRYQHLTLTERRHIYCWHHYDNLSNRGIARRLRRDHTTIGRELKRNSEKVFETKFLKDTHLNLTILGERLNLNIIRFA